MIWVTLGILGVALIAILVIMFIVRRGKCVVPSDNTCDDGKAWACLSDDAQPTCEPFETACGKTSCTLDKYSKIECVYNKTSKKYEWNCSGYPGQIQYAILYNATGIPYGTEKIGNFVVGTVEDASRACSADSNCKSFEYGIDGSKIKDPNFDSSVKGYQLKNNTSYSMRLPFPTLMNIDSYVPLLNSNTLINGPTGQSILKDTQEERSVCYDACQKDSNCKWASSYKATDAKSGQSISHCIRGTDLQINNTGYITDDIPQILIK